MATATIIINDADPATPEGISVEIVFDPPAPKTAEERAVTGAPPSAWLATEVMKILSERVNGIGLERATEQ